MTLTTTGIILWSMASGLLILGLLRKNKDDEIDENHEDHGAVRKHPKGGCCG
jgi:hypothetical protein